MRHIFQAPAPSHRVPPAFPCSLEGASLTLLVLRRVFFCSRDKGWHNETKMSMLQCHEHWPVFVFSAFCHLSFACLFVLFFFVFLFHLFRVLFFSSFFSCFPEHVRPLQYHADTHACVIMLDPHTSKSASTKCTRNNMSKSAAKAAHAQSHPRGASWLHL